MFIWLQNRYSFVWIWVLQYIGNNYFSSPFFPLFFYLIRTKRRLWWHFERKVTKSYLGDFQVEKVTSWSPFILKPKRGRKHASTRLTNLVFKYDSRSYREKKRNNIDSLYYVTNHFIIRWMKNVTTAVFYCNIFHSSYYCHSILRESIRLEYSNQLKIIIRFRTQSYRIFQNSAGKFYATYFTSFQNFNVGEVRV